jgi:DNA-binding response OmpR family regulator
MTALNLLYVDDEPFILEVGSAALELDPEIQVRGASSGPEALALLGAGWRPNGVLLDVMMPGMDGPTTLQRLRAIEGCAELPVIFLTAKAQLAEREALLRLDCSGVLLKPFNPKTLSADVRALLATAPAVSQVNAAPARRASILLADDDPFLRAIVEQRLESAGFFVKSVEDGAAALFELQTERYDAVILDGMMPMVDGFEVLRRLRATGAADGVPIVMLTALDGSESEQVALQLGAAAHMPKPFDAAVLIERLQALVAVSRAA